jgi:hypothetical protein
MIEVGHVKLTIEAGAGELDLRHMVDIVEPNIGGNARERAYISSLL